MNRNLKVTVTHPNGYTREVQKVGEIAHILRRYHNLEVAFDCHVDDEDQAASLRSALHDPLWVGHRESSYDPYEYGNGCSGDTEELEELLEELERVETKLHFEVQRIYKSTSNRVELSKQGKVARFNWKQAWTEAKLEMSKIGTSLGKLRAAKSTIQGELRARAAECHPELTRWFTSDMTSTCDVEEWMR